MNNNFIYLDNAATTKPYNDINYKYQHFDTSKIWMNPASLYANDIKYIVDVCKKSIIEKLIAGKSGYDFFFTSGATESNNWIIHNLINQYEGSMHVPSVICSPFEHPSIINTLKYYQEKDKIRIVYLDVDNNGHVIINSLYDAITDCEKPVLVTCMWVNNEVGSIQPIFNIANICKEYNIPFHVDATQAIGKTDIYMYDGISSMSFSGHKFHGPKGIGGLLIKNEFLSKIGPFIIGGHQQGGFRAGTEDVEKIKLFFYSFIAANNHLRNSIDHSKALKTYFKDKIKENFNSNDFIINSKDDEIPIINISFKNISGEYIVKELAKENIFISTGSACSTGDLAISDTIKAIGIPEEYQEGTIRISFDTDIFAYHIDTLIEELIKIFQN